MNTHDEASIPRPILRNVGDKVRVNDIDDVEGWGVPVEIDVVLTEDGVVIHAYSRANVHSVGSSVVIDRTPAPADDDVEALRANVAGLDHRLSLMKLDLESREVSNSEVMNQQAADNHRLTQELQEARAALGAMTGRGSAKRSRGGGGDVSEWAECYFIGVDEEEVSSSLFHGGPEIGFPTCEDAHRHLDTYGERGRLDFSIYRVRIEEVVRRRRGRE